MSKDLLTRLGNTVGFRESHAAGDSIKPRYTPGFMFAPASRGRIDDPQITPITQIE